MEHLSHLIDCHSHSNISPDGKNTIPEMYEQACELGLSVYGVSDHLEIDHYERDGYAERVKLARASMDEQKENQKAGTLFLSGVEIGQPLKNKELVQRSVKEYRYDFILYSLHRTGDTSDFSILDYRNEYGTQEKRRALLDQYYIELIEMVKTGDFDLIAHPTFPMRHMKEWGADLSAQADLIDELFRQIIQRGKGIEINTSGFGTHHHTEELMPELPLLKRYRELGGEILSLGSDAHQVSEIGAGLLKGKAAALEAGFQYLTFFVDRKPQRIKL